MYLGLLTEGSSKFLSAVNALYTSHASKSLFKFYFQPFLFLKIFRTSFFSGTTKIKNLDQNLGALAVKLSEEDLREISAAVPVDDIAGSRYYNGFDQLSWKFANTPPKV